MLTLLTRVDAILQRHFDRAIHHLMRRGATKRILRRRGWTVALAAITAQFTLPLRPLSFGVLLVFALCHVLTFIGDEREDQRAQASDARSEADQLPWLRKVVGLVNAMLSLGRVVLAISVAMRAHFVAVAALDLVCALVWLYQGYLAATTPVAPEKKHEPHLRLVLARAS